MVDVISSAADDMRERSDQMSIMELGVFHMKQRDNEDNEFILIGIDESNEEAVEIFEEWESEWRGDIRRESTDTMDDVPTVVVHEYREA